MKKYINALPLPIAGVMLALAAFGNLMKPYGDTLRLSIGAVSCLLLLAIVIKIIIAPNAFKEAFNQPPVAGVLATIPMGITILSTYAVQWHKTLGLGIWWLGIAIHAIFILAFTLKYLLGFKLLKLFPSYFVMYVGIVCASVAAPAHQMQSIGQMIFWFGFAAYVILLPLMLYRIFVVKQIPTPAMPTVAIFAAPASLLLAGYNSAFADKAPWMVTLLTVLALVMYIGVLIYMVKLLRLSFMPSFSAFTFPFVISAVALKPLSVKMPGFVGPHYFMMAFAGIMILYVLYGYIRFVATAAKKA